MRLDAPFRLSPFLDTLDAQSRRAGVLMKMCNIISIIGMTKLAYLMAWTLLVKLCRARSMETMSMSPLCSFW